MFLNRKLIKQSIVVSMVSLLSMTAYSAETTKHNHTTSNGNIKSEGSKALKAADHAMMEKMMAVTCNENADKCFVDMMIPYHQGAVDMAKIILKHSQDSTLRALAEDIIKEQDKELSILKNWKKNNEVEK